MSVYVEFNDRTIDASIQVTTGCSEDRPVPSLSLNHPIDGASETFLLGELADFAGLSVQVLDARTALVIACGTF